MPAKSLLPSQVDTREPANARTNEASVHTAYRSTGHEAAWMNGIAESPRMVAQRAQLRRIFPASPGPRPVQLQPVESRGNAQATREGSNPISHDALRADAAKGAVQRMQASSQDASDDRGWWARNMPTFLGGRDADDDRPLLSRIFGWSPAGNSKKRSAPEPEEPHDTKKQKREDDEFPEMDHVMDMIDEDVPEEMEKSKRQVLAKESAIGVKMAQTIFDALASTDPLGKKKRPEDFDAAALKKEQLAALTALSSKEFAMLYDKCTTTYVGYDNGKFKKRSSPPSTGLEDPRQPQKSFLRKSGKASEVASTVMHEYYHSGQSSDMNETDAETEAYVKERLWRQKRGLSVEKEFLADGQVSEKKIRDYLTPQTRGEAAPGREFFDFDEATGQVVIAVEAEEEKEEWVRAQDEEKKEWVPAQDKDWAEFTRLQPTEDSAEAQDRSSAFLAHLGALLNPAPVPDAMEQ